MGKEAGITKIEIGGAEIPLSEINPPRKLPIFLDGPLEGVSIGAAYDCKTFIHAEKTTVSIEDAEPVYSFIVEYEYIRTPEGNFTLNGHRTI